MMDLRRRKLSLTALGTVVVVAGSLVGLSLVRDGSDSQGPAYGYPLLFGAAPSCSGDAQRTRRASRAEQQAHFYAERYPYDPQDGIRAVLRFQEARSCYQQSGLRDHANRVESLASDLMARINVDYASSRLVFDGALASEKWAVALAELRRLLRLTEHVRGHVYVEYLWSNLGRVTVRANDAS